MLRRFAALLLGITFLGMAATSSLADGGDASAPQDSHATADKSHADHGSESAAHSDKPEGDHGETHADSGHHGARNANFPLPLKAYQDESEKDLWAKLVGRAKKNPINLAATIIFVLAILHTFVAGSFASWAHRLDEQHAARSKGKHVDIEKPDAHGHTHGHAGTPFSRLLHFLGEVECVFGLWVIPLMAVIAIFQSYERGIAKGYEDAIDYVAYRTFTEPMFVVIIMAIAASKPIIILAEQILKQVANLGSGTPAAWWLSILTFGPLLGSFITEPAAMTISAVLLAKQLYRLKPSAAFSYASIGLLFVNVSVGGVLTNFAAPPVLMVATKWELSMSDMLLNYGWRAVLGIVISNGLYFLIFRGELKRLHEVAKSETTQEKHHRAIPAWVTVVHLFFMAWTVLFVHQPALFIGGFLLFIGFTKLTFEHQSGLELRSPVLVGFFLAGLVIHGGMQEWWIAPVLGALPDLPLMVGATILTSFNDNAAITFLASLVPDFSPSAKYAVLAGAVTGGGLTVIANAPNPAGQSILSKHFAGGVSPLWLAVGALVPTIILGLAFMLGR